MKARGTDRHKAILFNLFPCRNTRQNQVQSEQKEKRNIKKSTKQNELYDQRAHKRAQASHEEIFRKFTNFFSRCKCMYLMSGPFVIFCVCVRFFRLS